MRERAELAGGQIVVDSRPGEGTHVVARLPVDDMQDD
jgi:signal transduction histidine kinase